jgi:hypothetical protein
VNAAYHPRLLSHHCPVCGAVPHKQCTKRPLDTYEEHMGKRWHGKPCDCQRCKDAEAGIELPKKLRRNVVQGEL